MKSKSNNFSLLPFTEENLNQIVSKRENEIKLGEKIRTSQNIEKCKYILLGICEDIGPQANHGLPGATNAFQAFISRFLNTQSNRFLNGEEIGVIGVIQSNCQFENTSSGRTHIEELDEFVSETLHPFFKNDQIPIIIGGGHNNAYPIAKAHTETLKKPLHVVNLDPHADCRSIEGRHSGNPFSYGIKDGFIDSYTVLGLHQNYNSETIYQYLDSNKCRYTFFDDYLIHPDQLIEDIATEISNSHYKNIGLEIDMDAIANMPSSAFTPSGLELNQVRKYIRLAGANKKIKYLHLPEGAPLNDAENKIVGKALSYLVIDFIKSNKSYL
jgi:formiminoglutamase